MRFQPPVVQRVLLSGAVVGMLVAVSLLPLQQQPTSHARTLEPSVLQQASTTPEPGAPSLDPPIVQGTLTPGSLIRHNFTIVNVGSSRDTFYLEIRPYEGLVLNGISANISSNVVVLDPGSSMNITVTVFARSTTLSGIDRRALRAMLRSNPNIFAEATISTIVIQPTPVEGYKISLPVVFDQ